MAPSAQKAPAKIPFFLQHSDVALKIVKSASHYTEAAIDEIKILKVIARRDPDREKCVVCLLDDFKHRGPNGLHVCMVFELLGMNLYELLKKRDYRGLPLPIVQRISKQILIGLDYLHSACSIIHTDLKPENILLVPGTFPENPYYPPEMTREERDALDCELYKNVRIKIADLGNACWVHKHFTSDIQTRQYRAPEVIVGAPYSALVDIWSMACIVFELTTGDLLFEPKAGRAHTKNDDHLAQMLELLEIKQVPKCLLRGKYSVLLFDRSGKLRSIRPYELKPWGLFSVLTQKYKTPPSNATTLADFILPMLDPNPAIRRTAKEALLHPWMKAVSDFD